MRDLERWWSEEVNGFVAEETDLLVYNPPKADVKQSWEEVSVECVLHPLASPEWQRNAGSHIKMRMVGTASIN